MKLTGGPLDGKDAKEGEVLDVGDVAVYRIETDAGILICFYQRTPHNTMEHCPISVGCVVAGVPAEQAVEAIPEAWWNQRN